MHLIHTLFSHHACIIIIWCEKCGLIVSSILVRWNGYKYVQKTLSSIFINNECAKVDARIKSHKFVDSYEYAVSSQTTHTILDGIESDVHENSRSIQCSVCGVRGFDLSILPNGIVPETRVCYFFEANCSTMNMRKALE